MVALIAMLLAGAGVVSSKTSLCDPREVRIDVLPFEVREDFSVPFSRLDGVAQEVGLVRETMTVHVEGCHAIVGYANPVLYVASELTHNACAFATVLDHERHHVDIYRAALQDLERRIRAAAADRPLFDAAVQELTAVQAANDEFDNAGEYRKNVTACRGGIYRLALHRDDFGTRR
jgi:hypothetical protein